MNVAEQRTLDALAAGRKLAEYAKGKGVQEVNSNPRPVMNHLGAVLADSALQAGLNYRTVVKPRIEHILERYPQTAEMSGISRIINEGKVSSFLQWRHESKIARFIGLAKILEVTAIKNVFQLRHCLLGTPLSREFLQVPGVGPKTVDYLSCLVGIDCVAVDRHVKVFAKRAGVPLEDYSGLKLAISFAADFLKISRRGFDAWIWNLMSLEQADAKES